MPVGQRLLNAILAFFAAYVHGAQLSNDGFRLRFLVRIQKTLDLGTKNTKNAVQR